MKRVTGEIKKYDLLLPIDLEGTFNFGNKKSSIVKIEKNSAGEQLVILPYESSLEEFARWITIQLNKSEHDGKLICPLCGGIIECGNMNIDHVVPRALGGISIPGRCHSEYIDGELICTVEGNLIVTHCRCNCKKGCNSLKTTLESKKMKENGISEFEITKFQKKQRKEDIKRLECNKTLLPDEMISTIPLSCIKVNGRKGVGRGYRKSSKYSTYSRFFKKHGVVNDTIILDRTYELIHGAVGYYIYKENNVQDIKCVILNNVIFNYTRR